MMKFTQNLVTLANKFGVSVNNTTQLFHMMCHKAGMRILAQIFGDLHM